MRIFKSKWFTKFAHQERISDEALRDAVRRADAGIVDANYGAGVIKQRIARPNEGRSGGYRSIILFREGERAFFVYGFAKNDRANVGKSEEEDFKELAKILLTASDKSLDDLKKSGKFSEVENEK